MARPRKEGLDYFPHDTDAVNDEKVEALRALYGNDGYAFYFILLERIYRSPQCQLDVSDAETMQILARKVLLTPEKFNEILKSALKRGCFNQQLFNEKRLLTSNGVQNRAGVVLAKRSTMQARYRVSSPVPDAETTEITLPETPQSIVKHSIVKHSKAYNTKGDNSKKFPPEYLDLRKQVFALLKERRGYTSKQPAAEAGAINKMIKEGFNPEQIISAHDKMKSQPFWQDKNLSMMKLRVDINEVMKRGNGTNSDNAAIKKQDVEIIG